MWDGKEHDEAFCFVFITLEPEKTESQSNTKAINEKINLD